jgi:hypothetical protein
MCSHAMCDLCGTRECSNPEARIRTFGNLKACASCVRSAVKFSYEACCSWGGTVIDVSRPCGRSAAIPIPVSTEGNS